MLYHCHHPAPTSATARCQHLCEMITVLGKASIGGEISGKNRLKNPIEVYLLLFSQIDAQTLQNCANKNAQDQVSVQRHRKSLGHRTG